MVLTLANVYLYAQETLTKVKSSHPVDKTVVKLKKVLEENNLKIFSTIDHTEGAKSVSMELNSTTLILFGNPALGTKLMKCDQRAGIDLPMKYLVWVDDHNDVWIGYWEPKLLKKEYALEKCDPVLDKMSGALSKFALMAAN